MGDGRKERVIQCNRGVMAFAAHGHVPGRDTQIMLIVLTACAINVAQPLDGIGKGRVEGALEDPCTHACENFHNCIGERGVPNDIHATKGFVDVCHMMRGAAALHLMGCDRCRDVL